MNARYYSDTLPYAAGGVMSSIDDLALWDMALSSDRLLKKESRERMLTSAKLANGRETGYGYGWYAYEYDATRMQEHGGVIFGFIAYVLRVPGERLYIALLTNRQVGGAEPYLLARKVALAALGRPFADPAVADLAPSAIDACLGSYETEGKTAVEFARTGDRITMKRGRGEPMEILPSSSTTFFQKGTFLRIAFEKDETGAIRRVAVSDWGNASTATRVEKPAARQ